MASMELSKTGRIAAEDRIRPPARLNALLLLPLLVWLSSLLVFVVLS